MKKKPLLLLTFLVMTLTVAAQTKVEAAAGKFEILLTPKLGFGKIKQTGSANLNGFINGADVLFSMRLTKKLNVAAGIGRYDFDANINIDGNTASLKNTYLQIPLKLKSDINLYKNMAEHQEIFFTIGLGLYANTLLKQELATATGSDTNNNMGWNFGFSSQIGAKFILSDVFNLGIGIESMSDFSKMEKDNIEQKMKNANMVYLSLGFKL